MQYGSNLRSLTSGNRWITRALQICALLALGLRIGAAAPASAESAKWEKEIRAFEAKDKTNPPPKNAVLFLGSSSIRLWPNLAASFPGITTIQRGFGGSCIPDSTEFADRIAIPYHPSKIVLYAGDNDIARGDSPELVFENFQKFVSKIHSALPETVIYYIAIKPSGSRWKLASKNHKANELIAEFCSSHKNLKFINIWDALLKDDGKPDNSLFRPDRLHLNEKGYAVWTKIIRDALNH